LFALNLLGHNAGKGRVANLAQGFSGKAGVMDEFSLGGFFMRCKHVGIARGAGSDLTKGLEQAIHVTLDVHPGR
jgi:hypothetical protein